jgi:hypothetical protein
MPQCTLTQHNNNNKKKTYSVKEKNTMFMLTTSYIVGLDAWSSRHLSLLYIIILPSFLCWKLD